MTTTYAQPATKAASSPDNNSVEAAINPATFSDRILKHEEDIWPISKVDREEDMESDVDDNALDATDPLDADGQPRQPESFTQRFKQNTLKWVDEHKNYVIYIVIAMSLALSSATFYFWQPKFVTKKHRGRRVIDWIEWSKWSAGIALVLSMLMLGAFYYTGHI